jgi:hypothetical protein
MPARGAKNRRDFHRFVPEVPRLEAPQHRRLECESPVSRGQGPNVARKYDYVVREVASALVAVASGAKYQEAAFTARVSVAEQLLAPTGNRAGYRLRCGTGRLLPTGWRLFTDPVLAGSEDRAWPQVVLLDSTSFWRRRSGQLVTAFHALLACGYDLAPPPEAVAACEGGHPDDEQWGSSVDFPDDLLAPPRPQLAPWPAASARGAPQRGRRNVGGVAALLSRHPAGDRRRSGLRGPQGGNDAWRAGPDPSPEFVNCRRHLANRLRAVLVEDLASLDPPPVPQREKIADARRHPLTVKVQAAFHTAEAYRDYLSEAQGRIDLSRIKFTGVAGDRSKTSTWLRADEGPVLAQIGRRQHRVGPESIGPLEAESSPSAPGWRTAPSRFATGPGPTGSCGLIVAGRRGQANERLWSEKIRQHLVAHAGVPPRQRVITERRSRSSL